MQLGELDVLFLVIVGVGLAAVVIGVVVFGLRRTSALSDELSKQAKARFDAIKPGEAPQGAPSLNPFMDSTRFKIPPPEATVQRESQPPRPEPHPTSIQTPTPETYPSALKAELQETKNRLQQYVQEITTEREATRSEMEGLRSEARTLSGKLQASAMEIEKLRGAVEEQRAKTKTREIETTKAQAGRNEIDKLQNDIRTLQEKLLTSSVETRKLKEMLEEQSARLKIVASAEAERARREIEGLRTDVQRLRAKLQASVIEIQTLKGSVEQQAAKRELRSIEPSKVEVEVGEKAERPTLTSRQGRGPRFWDIFRRRPIPTCQNCGRQLELQARFCDSCGQPVIAPAQNR